MSPTELAEKSKKKTLESVVAPSMLFKSGRGEQLTPQQVIKEIAQFMAANEKSAYKITIGSDSEQLADKRADFVTAIVVHRIGNGGIYYWRRIIGATKFHTLRDRIMQEVLLSLEIAQNFIEKAEAEKLPAFDFEIHVDVGEHGATRAMLQEVTGLIRANNFAVKTKPDSYAASKVADRHGMKND
jgi:uncharacterized protein